MRGILALTRKNDPLFLYTELSPEIINIKNMTLISLNLRLILSNIHLNYMDYKLFKQYIGKKCSEIAAVAAVIQFACFAQHL